MVNHSKVIINAIFSMMVISSFAAAPASADVQQQLSEKPNPSWASGNEKGWFWGERQKWEEEQKRLAEEEKAKEAAAKAEAEKPKEKDCTDPKQWDVTCGFVHPKRDFDFSQIQYAELTKQLAMYPDDANKVMQYQKFVRWAVDQAVMASKTAAWNIQQNQELNDAIDNPITAFGMRAAGLAISRHEKDILTEIADQGGVLVLFTRSDCLFCHKAYPLIRILSKESGIELYNAALDDQCLEGFDKDHCYFGDDVRASAVNLKVAMVPDLWLFLPKDSGWIRVSSGLETYDIIRSRIITFFSAARKAAIKGMTRALNSPQPAVDFSTNDIYERAKEAIGVAAGAYVGEQK